MDCSDIDQYKGLTPDNRLDVLSDFVNDWAEENDVEPPDVVSGDSPTTRRPKRTNRSHARGTTRPPTRSDSIPTSSRKATRGKP